MVAYSFQKRFCEAIELGLRSPHIFDFTPGLLTPKRQTIRAIGKRRHARPGETLQLYTGMRTRDCRKLGEVVCRSVEPIRIFFETDFIDLPDSNCSMGLGFGLDEFARMDGFSDWPDMVRFWKEAHGKLESFEGVLIQWGKNG